MPRRFVPGVAVLLAVLGTLTGAARLPAGEPYKPDPLSVRRSGQGYRYPQAGWNVLHIEGAPYDRGYQHGRLMAAEIADYVKALAAGQSAKAPADGWAAY